jgi:hypothetical protein
MFLGDWHQRCLESKDVLPGRNRLRVVTQETKNPDEIGRFDQGPSKRSRVRRGHRIEFDVESFRKTLDGRARVALDSTIHSGIRLGTRM